MLFRWRSTLPRAECLLSEAALMSNRIPGQATHNVRAVTPVRPYAHVHTCEGTTLRPQAEVFLKAALDANPEDVQLWLLMGILYERMDRRYAPVCNYRRRVVVSGATRTVYDGSSEGSEVIEVAGLCHHCRSKPHVAPGAVVPGATCARRKSRRQNALQSSARRTWASRRGCCRTLCARSSSEP